MQCCGKPVEIPYIMVTRIENCVAHVYATYLTWCAAKRLQLNEDEILCSLAQRRTCEKCLQKNSTEHQSGPERCQSSHYTTVTQSGNLGVLIDAVLSMRDRDHFSRLAHTWLLRAF